MLHPFENDFAADDQVAALDECKWTILHNEIMSGKKW